MTRRPITVPLAFMPESGITDTDPTLAYETGLGQAWHGDALDVLEQHVQDESVDLIMTSPPFALQAKKEYGNESQGTYVEWFMGFADEFWRVLKPTGSLVVDLGGAWEQGRPVKSLYVFELLIALCRRPRNQFVLAQDFYWYNPARLPSPAQWVTIERKRAKDAVNYIWWLGKTADVKANNAKVLKDYTESMKKLIASGEYNRGKRPSGHNVGEGFTTDRGGAIPPNILAIANTGNDTAYLKACKRNEIKPHPARFPSSIPGFFIDFLTDPGDCVLDPFAGSNVTGATAEAKQRNWISADLDLDYLTGSRVRFDDLQIEM